MVNYNTDKIKEAQSEAEQLRDLIWNQYNLAPIKIKVKTITKGGTAYYNTRFISIPVWTYNEGLNYFYAYVLHELGHFINYDSQNYEKGHNGKFKKIEQTLLKDFGLIPLYSRAYIKALNNERGQRVWQRHWR
jgi:predicted SprT family Zn-dependent metalloprotease